MGVKGLWDLLAPAGRRVPAGNLKGKVAAVDAAIWLVQFLHAMKRPDGSPMPAAHLVGFFNRLCRLLFFQIRPIIVFDGPPPYLKRQTLLARKRQRQQQEKNLRSVVARLLLNQLKEKRRQEQEGSTPHEPSAAQAPLPEDAVTIPDSSKSPSVSLVPSTTPTPPQEASSSASGAPAVASTGSGGSSATALVSVPSSSSGRSVGTRGDDARGDEEGTLAGALFTSSDEGDPASGAARRRGHRPAHSARTCKAIRVRRASSHSEASSASSVDIEVEAESDDEVSVEAESRGRSLARTVPEELRGFLSSRRQLGELPMPSILSMPASAASTKAFESMGLPALVKRGRDGEARKVVRRAEDFKAYRLEDDSFVQLPLDAEIDQEVFDLLPPKVQFQILTQLRDAWLHDSRVKALQAKNNIFVFSNVQLESYMRSVQANQHLTKVKRRLAAAQLEDGEPSRLDDEPASAYYTSASSAPASGLTPSLALPSPSLPVLPGGGTGHVEGLKEEACSPVMSPASPARGQSGFHSQVLSRPLHLFSGDGGPGAAYGPSRQPMLTEMTSLSGVLLGGRQAAPLSGGRGFHSGDRAFSLDADLRKLSRQRAFMNDLTRTARPLEAPKEAALLAPSELLAAAAAACTSGVAESRGGSLQAKDEKGLWRKLKAEEDERRLQASDRLTREGGRWKPKEGDEDDDAIVVTASGERQHIALLDDAEIFGADFFSPTADSSVAAAASTHRKSDAKQAVPRRSQVAEVTSLLDQTEDMLTRREAREIIFVDADEEASSQAAAEESSERGPTAPASEEQKSEILTLSDDDGDEFADCVVDTCDGPTSPAPAVRPPSGPELREGSSVCSPLRSSVSTPLSQEASGTAAAPESRATALPPPSSPPSDEETRAQAKAGSLTETSASRELGDADLTSASPGDRMEPAYTAAARRTRMRRRFGFGRSRESVSAKGGESAVSVANPPSLVQAKRDVGEDLSAPRRSSLSPESLTSSLVSSTASARSDSTRVPIMLESPAVDREPRRASRRTSGRGRGDAAREASQLEATKAAPRRARALRVYLKQEENLSTNLGIYLGFPFYTGVDASTASTEEEHREQAARPAVTQEATASHATRVSPTAVSVESDTGSVDADCTNGLSAESTPARRAEETDHKGDTAPEASAADEVEKLLAELGSVSFPQAEGAALALLRDAAEAGASEDEQDSDAAEGSQKRRRRKGWKNEEEDGEFMQLWLAVFPQLKEHLLADERASSNTKRERQRKAKQVVSLSVEESLERSDFDGPSEAEGDKPSEAERKANVQNDICLDQGVLEPRDEAAGEAEAPPEQERRLAFCGETRRDTESAESQTVRQAGYTGAGRAAEDRAGSKTERAHALTGAAQSLQPRLPSGLSFSTMPSLAADSVPPSSPASASSAALLTMGGSSADEHLRERLEEEKLLLLQQAGMLQQQTGNVTEHMKDQIIALLRAFGVPFVSAPGEAEATAASLTEQGLADAVISDDSDALVFGAREIYRNFFENKKSVEMYEASFVVQKLGLDRQQLILLAMLLGCDYTLGVKGIGIVNAVEVLRAFPSLDALLAFRAWAEAPWTLGIGPTDSAEVRKYKEEHKNYRLQWLFPHDFPSHEVFDAFYTPLVAKSKEPFSWAVPDVDAIVAIMTHAGGLRREEVLDCLLPSLKRYTEAHAFQQQTRLTAFLPFVDKNKGRAPSERQQREEDDARAHNALRAAAEAVEAAETADAKHKKGRRGKGKKARGDGEADAGEASETECERENRLESAAVWQTREERRARREERGDASRNELKDEDAVGIICSERMLRALAVLERRHKKGRQTGDASNQTDKDDAEEEERGKMGSSRRRKRGQRGKRASHAAERDVEKPSDDGGQSPVSTSRAAKRPQAGAERANPKAEPRKDWRRRSGPTQKHPDFAGDAVLAAGELTRVEHEYVPVKEAKRLHVEGDFAHADAAVTHGRKKARLGSPGLAGIQDVQEEEAALLAAMRQELDEEEDLEAMAAAAEAELENAP
ncbi:XPG N-terminal domain-containing protein [Besnoitia besnoiti]|uniref:XPG N-terminal domain-containing protein n=1 Tax=Besnoitia besnoiti TaxID=94643 RepID=A0A2A9MEU4_BESBE|nr:XPG N-terminal domain-containing protein [Besnoitia besnoiti]PFH34466.1 XPG N-terminal domain-containing protein [Besnoitia besnoiti]